MSYGGYGYGGGDGDGYGNNQGYNNQGGYNNGGGFGGPPPGPPPGQYGGYDDGNQGGYGQRDFGGPPPGPPPGQYDNSRWGGDGNENGDGGYEGRRAHGGYEGQQGGYGGRQNEYEAQGGYGGNSSGGYGNSGRHGGGGYENEGGRQNRYEGQSSQGGYGQSSQGGYGQSSQGGYGQSSQGGYGQSSQGGYGQSSQGGYGQSSQGGYDQGSQGGYGQSSGGQSSGARYGNPNYGGSHSTQNQRFNAPPSHGQSFGVEGVQNYKYSQCTGRRKALLIGINYIGQKAQLKGCINDVKNVRKFLIEVYGYKEDDMVVLTDDQQNQQSIPTKANILRACQWLVKDAQPNDSLFLHYSGHGGQESDSNGDENDGFDECIYPVDYASAGSIVDDVLHRALVSPLPAGARLTSLMDCCHSATVLDLPYVYSTKGVLKEPSMLKDAGKGVLSALSSYTSGDIQGVMSSVSSSISRLQKGNKGYEYTIKNKTSPADVVMISGCKDNQTSADSFEDGAATGAMSHAFIQVMRNNKNQSYLSLLNNMRDVLEDKYEQKPQLSCSHPLDCDLQFIM